MDSSADPNGAKRKRSPSDVLPPARPAPSTPSAAAPNTAGQINYLTRQNNDKLKLIEGDDNTFAGILQLLDEYDGVLQRRESLAGNLGASLVGPLLLNAFENYFQGPIYLIGTTKNSPATTVSWVDVVNYAREYPGDFLLEGASASAENPDQTSPQAKVCRFWIKNNRVQISENDWRLIVSGVPARMLPEQLNPEDESAEMVTLDILESRLSALIKKADAVATKTRQLNYQMKGRKNAIMARRSGGAVPSSDQQSSGEWGQQSTNSPFNAMAPNPQDLLRQFSLYSEPSTPTGGARSQGISSKKLKPSASSSNLNTSVTAGNASFTSVNPANSNTSTPNPVRHRNRSKSLLEDPPYRAVMVSYIEKLNRGDKIWPPCDRCRRLKMECIKNYTACLGCTKKHCKCFFRDVGSEEVMIAGLEADSEIDGNSEAADKKREGSQKANEGAAMTNYKPSENAFAQEGKDVEMGSGIDAGNSRPSSANNGGRSYYDPATAMFAGLANRSSPNGTTPAASGYPSNPNTMTATMVAPGSGISGGNASGGGNQEFGMDNSNYPVGNANAQPASGQESYAQQSQAAAPSRTQASDVNYIRSISGEGEAVLRNAYSMPSGQPTDDWKSNPQRDIQEPNVAFFAEMQRHPEGGGNSNMGVPDNSNTAPSA